MKDGAAVTDDSVSQAGDSTSPPRITIHPDDRITIHPDEGPPSEHESGVLLSEPTAYLTGDLSSFQNSLFSVDSSDEVVRLAKRQSIRKGLLTGILLGFPIMMLMFGMGYMEGDWDEEDGLGFRSEGAQQVLDLQAGVDPCGIDGRIYEQGKRYDWFSSSLMFASDCEGKIYLEQARVFSDMTLINGSATITHNLPVSATGEFCDISFRIRAAPNDMNEIYSSTNFYNQWEGESPSSKCDGELSLITLMYFEQEDHHREVNIGTVSIDDGSLRIAVNQSNTSILSDGAKQTLVSIEFNQWWDGFDPRPVIGYVDSSTLRFTTSAPLDSFSTPISDVVYRVQGGGMTGDEADATMGIMLMMMNGLCCFGLFILPLGVSLRKKDNHFAITQFLTVLPFLFIGGFASGL